MTNRSELNFETRKCYALEGIERQLQILNKVLINISMIQIDQSKLDEETKESFRQICINNLKDALRLS